MQDDEILVRGPSVSPGYVGLPARASDEWLRTADLATFCRERLAGYKVPRHIRLAAEPLPRTAAGKLLRRALPWV
jgi:acyl-CoA synthetase (AMP-forming)/AMP-acid ligase II